MTNISTEIARLLSNIIGEKIVGVRRYVYGDDVFLPDYEQLADGPIELVFSNGMFYCFYPSTGCNSVTVELGTLKTYGSSYILINPVNNDFWSEFIDSKIKKIQMLKSDISGVCNVNVVGIRFVFDLNISFVIEYVDYGEFSDSLRLVRDVSMDDLEVIDVVKDFGH